MTKEIILNFLKTHRKVLAQNFGVKKIGLFGSYARDEANSESDIDLVIETEKKDFFIREDLKIYLEDAFKMSVDIGYLSSFREFYKTKIEKEIIYV
ncbi:MAG: nucleotidyltransferase domain-containing protein [Campylobacterota bacterium]|nr:nucleotidyltransferase domain-containing protein [Campylobacterota bacterium]